MKRTDLGIGIVGVVCLLVASCGGGKTSTTTTTTTGNSGGLQITAPTTSPSIDAGQSVMITANQPVMWSLTGIGTPVGTLSNTTIASTNVTYTGPASVTTPTQVSVVATSAASSTQSAVIGVVVNPLPEVGVSGSLSAFANGSCQYDPIHQIGSSNGTVGTAYPTNGNPPQVLGGTGPYTWSVSSGSLPVGLSLGWTATTTASSAYLYGTSVSAGCSQVALQVTDATGATATSPTYYVIITPAALKIQVPHYTDAYSGVPYPPTAVSVSGGVPPYKNWSLSGSISNPLPPGMSFTEDVQNSEAALLSGTPTGGGSLAGNNGSPYAPTLQVVDSQTPYPAYGTAQLNIYQWASLPSSPCNPAQNANGASSITTNLTAMNGPYAFLLRGFDANGPVVIAGSFTTDGAGNISGGIEDTMRTTGSQADATITGGSYSIIQQNNSLGANTFAESGCVMLTTATGTNTFAISLGGCSTSADSTTGACVADSQGAAGFYTTGRMIEFDDNTGSGARASGIVRLQTSSAFSSGLSGSYSFGLNGWDSVGRRYAAVGSLSAGSGTLSSVAADINDSGVLQSTLTGGSGTYTVGSNGRGTGTLTVGTASLNLTFYVVSAQEVLLATTGAASAANPIVSGEAISAAGPFSAASLQNSHIFHIAGLAPTGPDPSIGILSFDGISSFSGTQYEDQGGTLGTTSLSGAYAVDANTGRLSFLPSSTNLQSLGDHPLVGYVVPVPGTLTRQNCVRLASCVTGFLLSTDASAQAGQLEFQTPTIAPPPPFSNLYVAGYYFYGTDEGLDDSTPLLAGAAAANPNGAHFAGIQSVSYADSTYCKQPDCALLVPNETLSTSGTYSVNSNGTGVLGGESVAVTNGNVIYYIDESPINFHPSVTVIEQ
ncbi:MAG: hypothetical protein WAM69_16300 [Candidatus Sulfotelmatobacter sp.]